MKFYLTLAMLALSLTIVNAQENNTFNSSRPGQASFRRRRALLRRG